MLVPVLQLNLHSKHCKSSLELLKKPMYGSLMQDELFRIKRTLSTGRYERADDGGHGSGLELMIQQQIETELERVLVYYL